MPPRKNSKTIVKIATPKKNSITNLFNKIEEKDFNLKECSLCKEKIKSCLLKDHLDTKCLLRHQLISSQQNDDIIYLCEANTPSKTTSKFKIEIKTETKMSYKNEPIECVNISYEHVENETAIKNEESAEMLNEPNPKRRTIDGLNSQKPLPIVAVTDKKEISNELEEDDLLLQDYKNKSSINKSELIKSSETEIQKSPNNDINYEVTPPDDFDYYLKNFTDAIQTVLAEDTFACLMNKEDYEVIEKFSNLKNSSKILYVRLFQRKFKWISLENIVYERLSDDLQSILNNLLEENFLIDENSIDTYEEIIWTLKLPQLKELAKICHVVNPAQSVKLRSEFIKLILAHFKTQKSLKFHLKSKQLDKSKDSSPTKQTKPNFMNQCKKILGKSYKLNKTSRDVFVRLLMLYSLSSTGHLDPSKQESGQQQLLQLIKVNMNKVKFMNYEIKINVKIFEERSSLLRYQDSLEFECELLNLIEGKDFDMAYEQFNKRVYEFKKFILDPDLNEYDLNLPIYLRVFTCGSVYCKILSIYAFEILQRLHKYDEANDLFEFLLYKQEAYLLSYRSKWFERVALNYESHLKKPIEAFETLMKGLKDVQYVRRAGRLALFQRLVKMSETKKYLKNNELKDKLKKAVISEKFDFQEAPVVEITGTILHSEYIPGRKNIFIQNFEHEENVAIIDDLRKANTDNDESINSTQTQIQNQPTSDILVKNRYNISVEQVALTHYIKNLNFTNGKHCETSVLTTLFGILFWDIIFEKSVFNVFIDKFQSCPLDLQTDFFYINRKEAIDSRLELLDNSPINFICELLSNCWNEYFNIECSLVSWGLFEDINEFLSLVRCFSSKQITSLCEFMAQNYRYCRSGGPDLIVWSTNVNKCKFVEVKGPGDKLSFKQIMWMDFFLKNSIECEVCYVKGQNSKRLRD